MSFLQLFLQSNLSLANLEGNALRASVTRMRGNKIYMDTGLKELTICTNEEYLNEGTSHYVSLRLLANGPEMVGPVSDLGRHIPGRATVGLKHPYGGTTAQLATDRASPRLHNPTPLSLPYIVKGNSLPVGQRMSKGQLMLENRLFGRRTKDELHRGTWPEPVRRKRQSTLETARNEGPLGPKRAYRRPLGRLRRTPIGGLQDTTVGSGGGTKLVRRVEIQKASSGRIKSSAEQWADKLLENVVAPQVPEADLKVGLEANDDRSPLYPVRTCIVSAKSGSVRNAYLHEPQIILPRSVHKIRRHILIWSELHAIWKGSNNCIKGFILNAVNGGYAVAIGGNIAFLPRSLRIGNTIFRGQWRMFSIENMNPKLRNIVVKEFRPATKRGQRQWERPTESVVGPKGPQRGLGRKRPTPLYSKGRSQPLPGVPLKGFQATGARPLGRKRSTRVSQNRPMPFRNTPDRPEGVRP